MLSECCQLMEFSVNDNDDVQPNDNDNVDGDANDEPYLAHMVASLLL